MLFLQEVDSIKMIYRLSKFYEESILLYRKLHFGDYRNGVQRGKKAPDISRGEGSTKLITYPDNK